MVHKKNANDLLGDPKVDTVIGSDNGVRTILNLVESLRHFILSEQEVIQETLFLFLELRGWVT